MTTEIKEYLVYCLLFVFSVVMFILIMDNIQTVETAGWTFTGHEFVASFLPVVPYLWLVGSLSVPIYLIVRETE